jgi:hypothetical protein
MKCSFDDKYESCLLEHVNKGDSYWEMGSGSLLSSQSKSGKNHINIRGPFHKGTFKTPIITHFNLNAKCLSFQYLIDNYSRLEVKKVTISGASQSLFDKEVSHSSTLSKIRINIL